MHLTETKASAQLSRLRKLNPKALEEKKNKLSGFFRSDSYDYTAFDNRTGNLWVGKWQHIGECLQWLNVNPG